jgi:opacity protein-like surface antigen
MGSARVFALMVMTVLAGPATALAGDMPAIPTIQDIDGGDAGPGSGPYLRGDLGYAFWHRPGLDALWTAPVAAPAGGADLDGSWSAGLGVGYQLGWMRADLTAEVLGRRDLSVDFAAFGCDTGGGNAICSGGARSNLSAIPILFNAYADFGHWGGFTPYVGAGIGTAYVDAGRWTTQESCAANAGTCPSPHAGDDTIAFSNPGAGTWRFAWALMAGVSYGLSENLSLDLGYRFLDIADGKVGRDYAYPSAPGTPLGSIKDKDLFAHEVRIGVRYRFE